MRMMTRKIFGTMLAVTAIAGVMGMAAEAAEPISALKGHDSNQPIDVVADRIEVQDRADRAIFAGNVHVTQGNLSLDATRIIVNYSSAGGIQIRRLDASGGVVVKSPSETARGDFGIYDTNRKLITLLGGVRLDRGENHVIGSRLVIDLTSGRAVIDGGAPGVGQSGGRVTGRFTVPQKS